jgi:chorismate synthase
MFREDDGAEKRLGANADADGAREIIRALSTAEDFRACADLQRLTWGAEFADLVPAHLMKIAQRIGGVAAGAFDDSGALLGFVFGMTGVRDGSPVHWSDMLAVRPESRGLGVGRRLKQYQRRQLLALGVPLVEWSFDPLVARNAHLNLVRLGATVSDYVVDMYGESASDLHQGLGTDRLIVSWPIVEGSGHRRMADDAGRAVAARSAIGEGERDAASSPSPAEERSGKQIRIAIPLDIHAVRSASPGRAREWRESTRAAFLAAIGNGYRITTFETDRDTGDGHYVLEPRGDSEGRPGDAS